MCTIYFHSLSYNNRLYMESGAVDVDYITTVKPHAMISEILQQ